MSADIDNPTWSETDSETYLQLAKIAVPGREIQTGIIVDLVAQAVANTPRPGAGIARVAELCCGGGDLASALLEAVPGLGYLGYLGLDGSEYMLTATARRLAAHSDRIELRRFDLGDDGWRHGLDLTACVSSLAVHHLDSVGKAELFKDIHRLLRPGGVFVLADLVEPATEVGRRIAADGWNENAKARSEKLNHGNQALNSFHQENWNYYQHGDPTGIDQPSGLTEILTWMGEAGFVGTDVHWMNAGHAVISAWRAESG